MVKRVITILCLFFALVGIVAFEQIYTENATTTLIEQTQKLQTAIDENNLQKSTDIATEINDFWKQKEVAISLFVDYRDIEQIAKQIDLVMSHLNNNDFELAKVECNLLFHIVKTFKNTISFDWQNII